MTLTCYCGAKLQPVDENPRENLRIERCPACAYWRSVYVAAPDRREIQEQHPSAYQGHDGRRFGSLIGALRGLLAASRVRRSRLHTARGGRIVDFGCGQGYFLGALRGAGHDCLGIEISEVTARRAMAQGFTVECSLERLEDHIFAGVASVHVIEHLPEPLEILRSLQRVLQPGARFYFEVPNAGSWQARIFGRRWLHCEAGLHVHHFTRPAFLEMLRASGYTADAVSTDSFEHGLLGWVQSIYNLVFPYNRFFRKVILNQPWREKLRCWPEFLLFPLVLPPSLLLLLLETVFGNGAVLRVEGRVSGAPG